MSNQHNVKGKVVLIAGGGKNLGGLLSRDFAAKGAKLAIHYNSESSRTESEKTLAEVQARGAVDTPFFYGQESDDAVAYHKSAAALGGLTDIRDIAPLVEFLVTDGWWITGQTIFANGGYTTR
ncbi:hypothetical protein [Epilithonimonas xixisoli]|uniref:Short subunit dehydrogenase n=1 Tax=Epilithonimonas xixisoli TaxID=1476462 RepID=A0A4R8IFF7_9FLAO|nr:hypothetical protein [Epilithonimonas xixisoli]TDX87256.1 hypothetical protein B0I22_1444 [Epilithonimonas xixisoli]